MVILNPYAFAITKFFVKIDHTYFRILILDSLALIFNTTCHHEAEQQGACAMAFGFASETHLALVLEKLEALLKAEFSKKRGLSASTFFGFMRDSKLEEGQLQIRCTILRCVGKKASFFVFWLNS